MFSYENLTYFVFVFCFPKFPNVMTFLTGFPFCSPWCRESQSQQAGRPWGCNSACRAQSCRNRQERRAAADPSWAAENTAARIHSTSSAVVHHCLSESFLLPNKIVLSHMKGTYQTAIKQIISFMQYICQHNEKFFALGLMLQVQVSFLIINRPMKMEKNH